MNSDNGVVYKILKFVKINGQAQLEYFPELSPKIAEWHFHYLIKNGLVSSIQSKHDGQSIINGLTTAGNKLLLEEAE